MKNNPEMIIERKKNKELMEQPNCKELLIDIKEFINEVLVDDSNWVAERRVEYLRTKIEDIQKNINWWNAQRERFGGWFAETINEVCVKKFEKEKGKIEREINLYLNPVQIDYSIKSGVTESDIERAKAVDCGLILEVKRQVAGRSWAICPFHSDTHPSLLCYPDGKGFYCFACATGGDAIDLVKKLYGYDFVSAVRFLIGGAYPS